MNKLEQFKADVEEQIERYKTNSEITEEHRIQVLDKLDFVLQRIEIFKFANEVEAERL